MADPTPEPTAAPTPSPTFPPTPAPGVNPAVLAEFTRIADSLDEPIPQAPPIAQEVWLRLACQAVGSLQPASAEQAAMTADLFFDRYIAKFG